MCRMYVWAMLQHGLEQCWIVCMYHIVEATVWLGYAVCSLQLFTAVDTVVAWAGTSMVPCNHDGWAA